MSRQLCKQQCSFYVIKSYLLLLCSATPAVCLVRVMEDALRRSEVIGVPWPTDQAVRGRYINQLL